ncbi:MAG: glycosyltransferase family 2 protein, partial [Sedimentisphaerales bacterium]
MDRQSPQVSVVVPLLNEQDNIRPLYEQITQALTPASAEPAPCLTREANLSPRRRGYDYEIIFVDDGSSDNSLAILTRLQKADDRVRVICFRKNFGQTAALSAGFNYARGNIIVAIDADLQNDPADIPKMITKLDEGFDV